MLLVVLVLVVGGGFAADTYIRHRVTDSLASSLEDQFGGPTTVELSRRPVIYQWLTKKAPVLKIHAKDATVGNSVGMAVDASLNDLTLTGDANDPGTAASTSASVAWPTDGILATLRSGSGFGNLLTGMTADPASGTLKIEILGGGATLSVRPKVVNGDIDVETTDLGVLGLGVPTDLVSGIVSALSKPLQSYPLGLHPTSITVTSAGLDVQLEGGAYQLPASKDGNPLNPCIQNC